VVAEAKAEVGEGDEMIETIATTKRSSSRTRNSRRTTTLYLGCLKRRRLSSGRH
jgi:hypothetical protein